MPKRSIEEDLALSVSMDILITAYQKVSVNRMQKTRKQVLAARKFTEALAGVYADVRSSQYSVRQQIRGLLFRKKVVEQSRKKKPLAVMIASNNRLDGGISQQVAKAFAEYVKEEDPDVIITGRVGAGIFKQHFPRKEYKYIDLPKHDMTGDDLAPLVELTRQYLNVKVFYGKFVNFIDQEPAVATLADEDILKVGEGEDSIIHEYTSFIFEPSLEEIVDLFDTQVLSALLARTAQEGRLAEHGSRVTAMEQARQNVDQLMEELKGESMTSKKERKNKRQREQLASLQLWGD